MAIGGLYMYVECEVGRMTLLTLDTTLCRNEKAVSLVQWRKPKSFSLCSSWCWRRKQSRMSRELWGVGETSKIAQFQKCSFVGDEGKAIFTGLIFSNRHKKRGKLSAIWRPLQYLTYMHPPTTMIRRVKLKQSPQFLIIQLVERQYSAAWVQAIRKRIHCCCYCC